MPPTFINPAEQHSTVCVPSPLPLHPSPSIHSLNPRGFCKHSSPSFAGWHRPYVWMFEQGLIQHAASVVDRLKTEKLRQQYKAILPTIRLPYW